MNLADDTGTGVEPSHHQVFDFLPARLLAGLRDEFTILENNAMASTASAAGYRRA